MTTLDARQATAPVDPALLAPGEVRRSAVSCIAHGTTPRDLRTRAVDACPDLAPLWLAWAAEAEDLAARGLTTRQAGRAAARLQRRSGAR